MFIPIDTHPLNGVSTNGDVIPTKVNVSAQTILKGRIINKYTDLDGLKTKKKQISNKVKTKSTIRSALKSRSSK